MVTIGLWSYRKVANTQDFYVAGGKMPWWLSGISHHMSGYSAAVFVAYAGVAYSYGFTLYVWWALPISIAVFAGAFFIAPQWVRLRISLNVASPVEYLALRYNVPTQQFVAWSGVILKLFDVGAKWASIGVILNAFTGISLFSGILLSGCLSLFYISLGGLWADALTDLAQFIVQLLAGLSLFVIVLVKLGGASALFTLWDRLPTGNRDIFNGPYSAGFCLAYALISFLSYNGGTWNLAQRYLAAPSASSVRRAALLSSALYLIWPLILFFPMWAAPVFLPRLADPTQSYSLLAKSLLPPGLVGLVLASMFAHTMAMTTSDANAVSAVITRDIMPAFARKLKRLSETQALKVARLTTVTFTALTLVVAFEADRFGGILDLLVVWFAGLVGPTAVPLILGLLPAFGRSNSAAAMMSWGAGLVTFGVLRYSLQEGLAATVASPVAVSCLVFVLAGWVLPPGPTSLHRSKVLQVLGEDRDA
jgi:SSS family solute:Na+ symporter